MSTTREEWLALAERIEKATGPDRGIDAATSIALGDVPKGFTADKMRGSRQGGISRKSPHARLDE